MAAIAHNRLGCNILRDTIYPNRSVLGLRESLRDLSRLGGTITRFDVSPNQKTGLGKWYHDEIRPHFSYFCAIGWRKVDLLCNIRGCIQTEAFVP